MADGGKVRVTNYSVDTKTVTRTTTQFKRQTDCMRESTVKGTEWELMSLTRDNGKFYYTIGIRFET